ncbi:MAG: hypothetical protein Q4D63_05265 [Neisseria animaloris]|uniref:type II restriction enzyme n=1 Tax=Neisseria animaloris TaxID=326522 RepID=UPI000D31DF43|nr:transcriptional regulator [Neisseria animaloris]MDO5073796.1 hypothetical protein [Neisseria animaloris]
MKYKKTKNDEAWEEIFIDLKILEEIKKNNFFEIRANQINKYREARLMTKFDHREQLPNIFSENNLSILPLSRGSYIIADMDIFADFPSSEVDVELVEAPTLYESIDYNNLTSEAAVINCAYVSGLIALFTQDNELKPTVSGRMSSSSFKFKISGNVNKIFPIRVENAQLEIDGGFEGKDSLNLLEAKISLLSNNFVIRKLFYPYRLWINKISKMVRPIFLSYSNGIFHFREYSFLDPENYNSIKMVREKKYSFQDRFISIEEINKILENTKKYSQEPNTPFPQADKLDRVINLCELLLNSGSLTSQEVTEKYGFDKRQTDYYFNAGRYLGLVRKIRIDGNTEFELTEKGKIIFKRPIISRNIRIIELILSFEVFHKSLQLYLLQSEPPSIKDIICIMKNVELRKSMNKTTMERRAGTVRGWINWILESCNEVI